MSARRPTKPAPILRGATASAIALVAAACFALAARATNLPTTPSTYFQTCSPLRPTSNGDWYMADDSGSTDQIHRFSVSITQAEIAAAGGSVAIRILDAESSMVNTGTTGTRDQVLNAPDPTRFELRDGTGTTVLQTQTVASGSFDPTTVTFTITSAGSYQITSVTGARIISGNATVGLNDDENSFTIELPGSSVAGQYQSTFQHSAGGTADVVFFFLVPPGTTGLFLRNYDLDSTGSVSYTRPGGAVVAGTRSGNGVWNGPSPTLNTGGDTVSGLTAADVGVWRLTYAGLNAENQVAFETNDSSGNRLPLYEGTPPVRAGDFALAASGSLTTVPGVAVDHPFTVTNRFFANDIVSLTTAGTSAGYTVSLRTSGGAALTDTNGDGVIDSGLLTPGQTKSFILRVTPAVSATTTDVTRIDAVSVFDRGVRGASAAVLSIDRTTLLAVKRVSGTVYEDVNHDGARASSEVGTGLTLFAKLQPAAGGNAITATAVNTSTGAYAFPSVPTGTYRILIDGNATLTDVTPGTGNVEWIGVSPPGLVRAGVIVGGADVPDQDLGLFHGGYVEGTVFLDAGAGGGTANDGSRQAAEPGITGVSVRLTDDAVTTTLDRATTGAGGAFRLYIPSTAGAASIRVIETNLAGHTSTGASRGTIPAAGTTYTRATDTLRFSNVIGTTYTAVALGDVADATLETDGVQAALPGASVVFPHLFTAGTAGTVTFTAAGTSLPSGIEFSETIYRDGNANGVIDAGDTVLSGSTAVTGGQTIALLVKVVSIPGAPFGAQDRIVVTSGFTFTGETPDGLFEADARTDVLTVGEPDDAALVLVKSADRATARSGDVIVYTVEYRNRSITPLTTIVVHDATPAHTSFVSAQSVAPLPAGISACTVSTQPSAGARGPIVWTLTGALASGAVGTVRFSVRVD